MTNLIHRRNFAIQSGASIFGAAAAACLMQRTEANGATHFAPKAKRVVFLHQSGAPSQIDLFDDKPKLKQLEGEELPDSIRKGQRLTTMTQDQAMKSLVGSPYPFKQHGENGVALSSQLPHTAKVADHLCLIRSMTTDAINHDPAVTLLQTGSQQPGRPSLGAWLSYGLARERAALPDFVVMVSGGRPGDQPLSSRLWSSGFLPNEHGGLRMRNGQDPLLFLNNPPGLNDEVRREQLRAIEQLDTLRFASPDAADGRHGGEPSRDQVAMRASLAQRHRRYEQAFQLQELMPTIADVSSEPASTWRLYGDAAREPGTYAANCLRARRLLEAGVPFVQIYHRGWDHHEQILQNLPIKCEETDQPSAALVADLAQRGLLDDTLVIWAGEFGRTAFCQGALAGGAYGRDHHPKCFSLWMAGGGVKPGTHGVTDDFSYNVLSGEVHIHDLQATILRLLGFDHQRLTFRAQGRDYRLTDQFGEVVDDLIA